MSNKAKELEPERARSLRNFKVVLSAFFIGIAIGTYVETHFFMTESEASWLWSYGRGKALISVDSVSNGKAFNVILAPRSVTPVFDRVAEWTKNQVIAVKTIDTKYQETGKKLRSSLLRIIFLWSFLAAAIAYTGISVLEARKDG